MIIYIGISCMSTLAYTWLTRIAIAVTTDDGRYLLMWVSINSTAIAIDCYWMKQMFIWIDQFATIVRRLRRELRPIPIPCCASFQHVLCNDSKVLSRRDFVRLKICTQFRNEGTLSQFEPRETWCNRIVNKNITSDKINGGKPSSVTRQPPNQKNPFNPFETQSARNCIDALCETKFAEEGEGICRFVYRGLTGAREIPWQKRFILYLPRWD